MFSKGKRLPFSVLRLFLFAHVWTERDLWCVTGVVKDGLAPWPPCADVPRQHFGFGIALGSMNWPDIEPVVKSFKSLADGCSIFVIFIHRENQDLADILGKHGVFAARLSRTWPFLPSRIVRLLGLPRYIELIPPNISANRLRLGWSRALVLRNLLARAFLECTSKVSGSASAVALMYGAHSLVLMMDLRDLTIQADPFGPVERFIADRGLPAPPHEDVWRRREAILLFEEHPRARIRDENANREWMQIFSDVFPPQLMESKILNSGFIASTVHGQEVFAQVCLELQMQHQDAHLIDQAIVHVLAYAPDSLQVRTSGVFIVPKDNAIVQHLALELVNESERGSIKLGWNPEDGLIVKSPSGEIAAVAHQYDRFFALGHALTERWRSRRTFHAFVLMQRGKAPQNVSEFLVLCERLAAHISSIRR